MSEDDSFNLDDVMEIFGGDVSMPVKEEAPVATKPPEASAPVSAEGDTDLTQDELAIIAEYEAQKRASEKEAKESKKRQEQEQRKILEDLERERKLKEEKAAQERQQAEEKKKADLEEKESLGMSAEDELRIIEEFEREQASKKEEAEKAKREAEEKAQAELKALQEKEKVQDARREEEEKKLKEKLASKVDSAKQGRLQELLAKTQKDLGDSNPLAPLASFARSKIDGLKEESSGKEGAQSENVAFISMPTDITAKENEAAMLMFDESRKAMFTFLAPLIGIRAINNMLTKTVEKARAAYPVLLKDVNWLPDGDLRDDGSIDGVRLFKNYAAVPAHQAVETYLGGLGEITRLRVKSVEMGLGEKVVGDLKAKLAALRDQFEKDGVDSTMIAVYYYYVLKD